MALVTHVDLHCQLPLSRVAARPRLPRRHEKRSDASTRHKDLTTSEREALLTGDVGALFRMGANAFLMAYMARFEVCGLNVEIYNQRMRAEKVDDQGRPLARLSQVF